MKIDKSNRELIKTLAKAHEIDETEFLNIVLKMGLVMFLKELEWYGSVSEMNKVLQKLK